MPVATARPNIDSSETYPIQNEHKGPATFTHGGPQSADQYRWNGKNSADGSDVQFIPGNVIKTPGFQRMLATGLFTFAAEDVDYAAIQGDSWVNAQAEQSAELMKQLERDDQNELVQLTCIGPGRAVGGKAPGLCGETLFMRGSDVATTPPLCSKHKDKMTKFFEFNGSEWKRIDA